jgi:putative ABC transport system permease protein
MMKDKNISFSDSMYRLLLRAYPSEFRVEYGAEMAQLFRDRCSERGNTQPVRFVILWLRTVVDCAATAPGEHMEILTRDIRYAFRVLRQTPAFTAVAVLALALGIGATTAIFSIANAVLLRPLPYPEPDRLVWLSGTNPTGGIADEGASGPDYLDWRDQNKCFEGMGCFAGWQPALTNDGEPERISGGVVSANLFNVLGRNALLGRTFLAEEEQEGRNQVVVLAYSLWQRRFGGDPNVIGRTLTLNSDTYTVVGVMPSDFRYPRVRTTEIWTTQSTTALAKRPRRADFLGVIGRLKPGITIPQAHAEMAVIAEGLQRQYPASNTGWNINTASLLDRAVRGIRPALMILLVAVALLLVIACANVSNLLLVRATARQKEIAVRIALGAARGRLIRQLLTESVLLALLGGVAGLVLAFWGVRGLVAISPPDVPRITEAGINLTVLGFTLLICLVTGVGFGLAPALQSGNVHLSETLKEGGRGSAAGAGGNRLRGILTAAEVSLALVLLIGAGLMIKSFVRLQKVNPGFNSEGLVTMQLSLPRAKYAEDSRLSAFYGDLLERVAGLPGVQAAGATTDLPIADGGDYLSFTVDGRPPAPPGVNQDAELATVSPGFFQTMGIRLLDGRQFESFDGPKSAPVVVINDLMARKYFRDEEPLGKKINFGGPDSLEIVGIVTATRTESLDAEPYSQAYQSYSQNPSRSMSLVLRGSADPLTIVPAVRAAVASIDREQPVNDVQTMEQVLSASIARQRLSMLLLAIFAMAALSLAGVGIYGVMAYAVKQRTHEIGVRMALGANTGNVTRLIVGQGMALAGAGAIVGLAVAFGLTRLMSKILFGVSAADFEIFVFIPIVIGIVALLACYIPARRATRVDPITALRCE